MSWESRTRKIYEARVVNDVLARLSARVDVKALPFSDEELKTFAKRSREAMYSRERGAAKVARYKAHLAKIHGADVVDRIGAVLVDINNEIGYEEK